MKRKNREKNTVMIAIGIFVFLVIMLVTLMSLNKTGVDNFEKISAYELEKLDANAYTVVYIGRDGCDFCEKMMPNLIKAQKEYGYTTKYLDLGQIMEFPSGNIKDQEAYDIMINYDVVDGSSVMDKFGTTPMILVIHDKKIVASQVGYREYDVFEQFLEKAGLKK